MKNTSIIFTFTKNDFVTIFKACKDRSEKLDILQNTSNNEDVIADAGNELLEINILIRELESKADKVWGEKGWTSSDEYL